MNQVKFDVVESSSCPDCKTQVPLTETICHSCNEEMPTRLTIKELIDALFFEDLVDVRAGGLVLGRHDENDDIPLFSRCGEGVFQALSMMQGGEYIVNSRAVKKHLERLKKINSFKSSEAKATNSIPLTNTTRVFNTNGIQGGALALCDEGQFVINRAATQRYYQELDSLNASGNEPEN
ncbi:MAG TPA: hypothetical protein VGO47_00195 [Chlamydiales bacterium]|jgi:hypothetical protein|nr:hypothetical protein [Chlamydiales bacterium]